MINKNITFTLNGQITEYTGTPSARLLDVLRDTYGLTGTKCGCREGECGACSVIIGGRLINSCLAAMGNLHGLEVTTIEGYSKTARFKALDKAFMAVSAVQCGYCTPGMILACESLLSQNNNPSEDEIRVAISGNLCRCTGYNAIVKAVAMAASELRENTANIPADENDAPAESKPPAGIATTLTEALQMLQASKLIPCCGGTDLMVDEDCEKKDYLFIGRIPELRQIKEDSENICFGAACTFTETMNHPLTPGILKDMCRQIAAPAIRNAGTIGGNIAGGSAKADSALIFMVTDSKLRLVSENGERTIPIKEFYTGGGKTCLRPGELLTEIIMPKHGIDNFYLKKTGARKALAIARVSFAGIIDIQEGIIKNLATAFGAVTDTIIRRDDIDQMLIGKTVEEARKLRASYLPAYAQAITPRRGRVGIEYRKNVCINLLRDFLDTFLAT